MIGGALARPCISYPEIFAPGTIWDRYPYLLPNLFSALIVLVGVVNGILFLEETHAEKKLRRDRGRELGDWILSGIPSLRKCAEFRDEKFKLAADMAEEEQPLVDHDEQLPGYRTNENSPQNSPLLKSTRGSRLPNLDNISASEDARDSRIFTRPVILNIMSFGILALYVDPPW